MTMFPDDIDVLIIGAGLFGSIIGKHLAKQGRQVTIVDAGHPDAGSGPAACLMKPSWLTKMTKAEQAQSLSTLDGLYGVHEIEAYVGLAGLGKRTTVFWVAPASIFKPERCINLNVTSIRDGEGGPTFTYRESGPGEEALIMRRVNTIIVAAGIWCNKLLERMGRMVPGLQPQWGVAFTWPCNPMRESRATITPWAPYKQLIMLPNRRDGELWVSDGTAVKFLKDHHIQSALVRCRDFAAAGDGDHTQLVGARPYIRGLKEPAFVERVSPNIWVATGGAKNGTAGAGWAAYRLAEALQ